MPSATNIGLLVIFLRAIIQIFTIMRRILRGNTIKKRKMEKLSMLKKEDDLMVGNEIMDKTTNRAYLASATAFAQILLRRTSDTLGTLDEIFKSKFIKRVKGRIRDGKSERAEC